MPKGKKPAMKKPAAKKMSAAEMKVEKAEMKMAKKLPPADRKKFAAMHKSEMKMEGKEK
jgi:hypothetical protein